MSWLDKLAGSVVANPELLAKNRAQLGAGVRQVLAASPAQAAQPQASVAVTETALPAALTPNASIPTEFGPAVTADASVADRIMAGVADKPGDRLFRRLGLTPPGAARVAEQAAEAPAAAATADAAERLVAGLRGNLGRVAGRLTAEPTVVERAAPSLTELAAMAAKLRVRP